MKKKNREDHRVEGKIAIEKKIAINRRGGKIEMEISRRIDDETENRGEERCDRSKVQSILPGWRKGGGGGGKGEKVSGASFACRRRIARVRFRGRGGFNTRCTTMKRAACINDREITFPV